MARAFTPDQAALLRSDKLAVNALITFFLDEVNPDQADGAWRFTDSVRDLSDGTHTWIGASSLLDTVEISSGQDLAAESVTLVLDGNRMTQAGINDPAKVLSQILGYLFHQRRVDMALGFRYIDSEQLNLVVPAYAGKINYARLVDGAVPLDDQSDENLDPQAGSPQQVTRLEIILDSLAMRYNRATNRVRTHQDQLEIDPTDKFFSFVSDAVANEQNLYWGENAPVASAGSGGRIGTIPKYQNGEYRRGRGMPV